MTAPLPAIADINDKEVAGSFESQSFFAFLTLFPYAEFFGIIEMHSLTDPNFDRPH